MPVQTTYPGVYIQEIPSGVRTINGVATSITLFIGWAPQGPTDEARRILSWDAYVNGFGGLHRDSPMSYAVSHFYMNGGLQAYILRVADPAATLAKGSVADLTLTATGPGTWANGLIVRVKLNSQTNGTDQKFGIEIVRRNGRAEQRLEFFPNLSMLQDDKRFVESLINNESQYINTKAEGTSISEGEATLADGEDGQPLRPDTNEFHLAVNAPADDDPSTPERGWALLEKVDLFNIVCIPGETDKDFLSEIADKCVKRRAFLIIDAPAEKNTAQMRNSLGDLPTGDDMRNAAFYFPQIRVPDPLQEGRLRSLPPCGAIAGIYARTDATRGVWKAPAGVDASFTGVNGPAQVLSDNENGTLNPVAVNCIRSFPTYGTIIWGARTLRGQDEAADEWKYIPVRRTALFIEESLYRGLKWVVFEPNDEPLWASIRLNVGAFMNNLFRQGAFQGRTPREAYLVKCDSETTTQNDINLGIVNIRVGFAPLKPAEFVIIQIQQLAGQIEV